MRLITNKGHTFAVGNSASTAPLLAAFPNKQGGFLAAIRGYEQYTQGGGTATIRGPLETLQFVWAHCNPVAAGARARMCCVG